MRWSSLVLVALVGCTSTQSDMVEPTIDPPEPIAWLELPAASPAEPPPPGGRFVYYSSIAQRVIAEAEAHQAVRASVQMREPSAWIEHLSRAACEHFGCGPCVAELSIQHMHCSTGLRRIPLEVTGCAPDD